MTRMGWVLPPLVRGCGVCGGGGIISSWWRRESNSGGWWEDEEVGGEGSEVALEEAARLGLHGWMISWTLWMSWGMETSGHDEIMR
ncbi:hypothetical protein QJS04_geneDACA014611 [Acorus gramineus]|uniref:Uncharacterized protein n=1 Tax=Acorus gramineus TaxID=55184 RepID=A0AAV9ARE5_ACOGR|nr:hypothetical protein QJS04_geneDACA014611 [Acorus gramineus]